MDLFVYALAFQAYAYLFLRRNVHGWFTRAGQGEFTPEGFHDQLLFWQVLNVPFVLDGRFIFWIALNVLIAFILMLLLEPIMLSLFATTPGKALLGIKIKNRNGSNLTIGEAAWRVWWVFWRGMGFGIPFYSLYRAHESYVACKMMYERYGILQKYGQMEWDDDEDLVYTVKQDNQRARTGGFVTVFILCTLMFIFLPLAADMPKHRGSLTTYQLHENFGGYWQHSFRTWNLCSKCHSGVISWQATPCALTITETDGIVTMLRYEISAHPRTQYEMHYWTRMSIINEMQYWARNSAVTFIGAQRGMSFIQMHFPGGVLCSLQPLTTMSSDGYASGKFIAAGIEVAFFINHNSDSGELSGYFQMRKI